MTPFELLGLPADADERAVKRAYARLLKINRPEDNPQGFASLHAVYKAALHYVQWRDAARSSSSPSSWPSSSPPPPPAALVPRPPAGPVPPPIRLVPPLPAVPSPPAPSRPVMPPPAVPPVPAPPSPAARRASSSPPAVDALPVTAAAPLPRIAVHELESVVREILALLDDPRAVPDDVAGRLAADELQPFVVREAVEDAVLRALMIGAAAPEAAKLRVLVGFFGWEQAAAGAAIGSPAALRRRNMARAVVARLYAAEQAAESAAAAQRKAAAEALALQTAAARRAEEAFAALVAPRPVRQLLRRLRCGAAPAGPLGGMRTLELPMGALERWLQAAFVDRRALAAAMNTLRRHGGSAVAELFHAPSRDFFAGLTAAHVPLGTLLALYVIRGTAATCAVALSIGLALALTPASVMEAGEKLAVVAFAAILAFVSVFLGSCLVDAWRRPRQPLVPQDPAAARRRRRIAACLGGAGAVTALVASALSMEAVTTLGASAALLAAALQFRRSGDVTGLAVIFSLATFPTEADRLGALSPLLYACIWFLVEGLLWRGRPASGRRPGATAILIFVLLVTAALLAAVSGRLADAPGRGPARPARRAALLVAGSGRRLGREEGLPIDRARGEAVHEGVEQLGVALG